VAASTNRPAAGRPRPLTPIPTGERLTTDQELVELARRILAMALHCDRDAIHFALAMAIVDLRDAVHAVETVGSTRRAVS
jgi:hypothetical protein